MTTPEEFIITAAHTASMSRDPITALHGRFDKQVSAAFARWLLFHEMDDESRNHLLPLFLETLNSSATQVANMEIEE